MKRSTSKHAIFLFKKELLGHVIPAYAGYLLEIFSADEIAKGEFTAVGAVHIPPLDDKHHPRTVCHYWTDYEYRVSRSDPHLKNFVHYVEAGQLKSLATGESQHAVERIAGAFLRLAGLIGSNFKAEKRRYRHRQLVELLQDDVAAYERYLDLVRLWAVNREKISKEKWDNNLRGQVEVIAHALCGEECSLEEVGDFLAWPNAGAVEASEIYGKSNDNVYRHKQNNGEIWIRLGSIHSVKGETHTATLVLETYFKSHHLERLKSWILGLRKGSDGTNDNRLKVHYVAMTRPSHLLCMAMKEDSICDEDIKALQQRGFRVGHVQDGGTIRWCSVASE